MSVMHSGNPDNIATIDSEEEEFDNVLKMWAEGKASYNEVLSKTPNYEPRSKIIYRLFEELAHIVSVILPNPKSK